MKRFETPLDLIRDSVVVGLRPRELARPGARLWAQLELVLPGSMKDRVALRMIEDAEARGDLRPGGVIVESSSGSMAEGLARVGALKGYRVIIVTDPRVDPITEAKLRALGAELEVVDTYDPRGGWQRSRLRRVGEVMQRVPHAFWACQYDTASNPAAYEVVGAALREAFGKSLAALVGTVGTGGSLCGLARSLRRFIPDLHVVAVDAAGSVLFHQPNRTRLQSGHGNSVVPGNVDYRAIDEVHWVGDGEAFNGCLELARRNGIFAGGSSGAAYVVSSWVAERYSPDRAVVAIFPDRGDRYHGSIYSDEFRRERGIADKVAPAAPLAIRYGVDVAEGWCWAEVPRRAGARFHAPEAETTVAIAEELGLVSSPVEARVAS